MNKLTKDQKDEYATSFAAIALYDGGVSLVSYQKDRTPSTRRFGRAIECRDNRLRDGLHGA